VEAKSAFPRHVRCSTVHGLAFREVGRHYAHRLNAPRQKAAAAANLLGINAPTQIGPWLLYQRNLARIALDTIEQFCHSADMEITATHIPKVPGMEDYEARKALADVILPYAVRGWNDLNSTGGVLKFEHDHYLKMWQLTNPMLDCDYILLDEAQDTNGVISSVVLGQKHAQLIAVGDSCQPTGTLVSVVTEQSQGGRWESRKPTQVKQVPIEEVNVGDLVVSYNVAGRYMHRNGSPVLGFSSRPFVGNLVRVEDRDGRVSRYTPDHHCVVRFGDDIIEKHVVYLMQKGDNFRIGTTGGRMLSQKKRLGLVMRALHENADAVWIVSVHETRAEARTAEAINAWSYRVPDVMFRPLGHSMGKEGIDKFWQKLGGNRASATELLADHGRDIEFPLWSKGQRLQTRRAFVARACNLIDGMEVLPLTPEMLADGHAISRKSWVPISVSHEPYTGDVWSMTVEGDHTYVGDGIVTHNCQQLYGWRGAIDAMAKWPDAVRRQLTQSWRYGQEIADQANIILDHLNADLAIRGNPALDSTVGTVERPDAVLCRTNAEALKQVMQAVGKGLRVALVGGGGPILRFALAAMSLKEGRGTDHPDLCAFRTWAEVQEYVEQDASGSDLKAFVELIDEHGAEAIRDLADTLVEEKSADVVVSTGHKAKGREWDTVLAADFPMPWPVKGEYPPIPRPFAMLAYVVATRARLRLDNSALKWIETYEAGAKAGDRRPQFV
jgi:hypothetical protein